VDVFRSDDDCARRSNRGGSAVSTPGVIVVAEDTRIVLEYFTTILSREGYDVRPADSGEKALAHARLGPVDLVLTDLMMPGMDGLDLIRALKAERDCAAIPVIVITSASAREEKMRALAAGAVDYLEKPVDRIDLLARVRSHVQLSQAQRRLQDSDAMLRAFFEHAPIGKAITDVSGHFLRVNAAYCSMVGHTSEELTGRDSTSLIHPDERPARQALLQKLLNRTTDVGRLRTRYLHKGGRIVWANVWTRLLWSPDDKPMYMLTDVQDISKEHEYAHELGTQKELFADLITALPVGAYRLRVKTAANGHGPAEDRVEFASPRFCEIVDLPPSHLQVDATSLFNRIHPEDRDDFVHTNAEAMRQIRPFYWEGRIVRGTGAEAWVRFSSLPRRLADGDTLWTGVLADISDRHRAEEEKAKLEKTLAAAQRMESLGRLASGIAHDFNNLLSVVLTSSDFLLDALPSQGPARDDALEIKRASQRATALIRKILAFGRRQLVEPTPLDLVPVLRELGSMLRRLVRSSISIELALPESPMVVHADPAQVEQVVVNLVLNASDAMPDGGHLRILLDRLDLTSPMVAHSGTIPPGSYVQLSVIDNGTGMDAETQAKMFDPFFTTKAPGIGTGLGLATVFGIVSQSNGYIAVHSEVNRGSTFRVVLPMLDGTAAAPRTDSPQESRPVHGETILLVEDDEEIRALTARLLVEAGYTVLSAPNGPEALTLIAGRSRSPDLLITDLHMPVMDAGELIERVRARIPDCKTLCISGYADSTMIAAARRRGDVEFLSKPIERDKLLAKISHLLQSRREGRSAMGDGADSAAGLAKERAGLAPSLVDLLLQAARAARRDAIAARLDQLEQDAPLVARRVAALLADFDYEGIIELLRSGAPRD
jgi:PAS domain S-box-containing protein